MNRAEHVAQSEMLLRESEQELAVAHTLEELALVRIHVEMAKAHAMLAQAKKVLT